MTFLIICLMFCIFIGLPIFLNVKKHLRSRFLKSQNMKHYQVEIFMYTVLPVVKW